MLSIIVSKYFPSTPIDLCNKYKHHIAENLLQHMHLRTSNADLQMKKFTMKHNFNWGHVLDAYQQTINTIRNDHAQSLNALRI